MTVYQYNINYNIKYGRDEKMILLLNKSAKPWDVEVLDKSASFSKTKDSRVRSVRSFIRTMPCFAMDKDLKEISLDHFVNMKEPEVISDIRGMNISYGRKQFSPFIVTTSNVFISDVILITLNLNSKILTGMSRENISVLGSYILAGELTIIVSINRKDVTLFLEFLDKDTKMITEHALAISEVGEIYYNEEEYDAPTTMFNSKGESLYIPYMLNNFRPSRPTYTILTMNERDRKRLIRLNERYDSSAFNVINCTESDINNVVTELKQDRYSAVTLFVDSEYLNNVTKKKYSKALSILEHEFKTFYVLLNNNKITKIKY